MSIKQLSRRLERTGHVGLLVRTPMVRAYLAGVAALHGVDADELRAEVEAVLTTWRTNGGNRLPEFEELLAQEAMATGRTVAAVRAELLASVVAWARSGR